MQTGSIKWNYSSNQAGDFHYKSNSRTNHNRHCIIGFLINDLFHPTLLFFRKEIYFFECLCFSEYDIKMSLYIFLVEKVAINRGCRTLRVRTHSCFWWHFCLIVPFLICRNLSLPLFKKDVFVRNGYFFLTRSISVVIR